LIKNIIARRYASALLELIKEDELSHFEKEIIALQTILNDEPEIEEFLVSPIVEDEHKTEIIGLLVREFDEKEVLHNFLNVLVEKERIFFLADILKELISRIHKKLGIFDFEVKTAHDLDEETSENIKNFISKYVDGKIIFKHTIDTHIRGGFLAYNDELAVNASIRNNLDALKREF